MSTRSYLLAAALTVAALRPVAAQVSSVDSVAVSQRHEKWFRGLLAHDTTALSDVLTSDVTLGFATGSLMPRKDFLQALQGGVLAYDSVEHVRERYLYRRVHPRWQRVANGCVAIDDRTCTEEAIVSVNTSPLGVARLGPGELARSLIATLFRR